MSRAYNQTLSQAQPQHTTRRGLAASNARHKERLYYTIADIILHSRYMYCGLIQLAKMGQKLQNSLSLSRSLLTSALFHHGICCSPHIKALVDIAGSCEMFGCFIVDVLGNRGVTGRGGILRKSSPSTSIASRTANASWRWQWGETVCTCVCVCVRMCVCVREREREN